jgi:hypothetical protein
MSNSEIVKALRVMFDTGDLQHWAEYFSDDFLWVGSFPKPLNKKNTLLLLSALKAGIPDLSLNFHFVAEVGENIVRGTIEPTGTHTAPIVLPGVAPLPPTGKSFAATRQLIEYTVVNENITRFEISEAEGGELFTILGFLGLDLENVLF